LCGRYDAERNEVRPVPLSDQAAWPFVEVYGEVAVAPEHHEIILARMRRLLILARATNGSLTTPDDAQWVERIIADGIDALREPLRPAL